MAEPTTQDYNDAGRDLSDLGQIVSGAADLANPGHDPGTVTTRLGQTTKTVAKIIEELSERDIGDGAAALINQRMFRSGTIGERGPTPFQNYPSGLHYFVTDINPPRMFAYTLAGQRNPIGQVVTANDWYGYYTPTEIKNLGIDFTGQLQQANIAGLLDTFGIYDANTLAVGVSDFRARALTSVSPVVVQIDWEARGALTSFSLSWKGYTAILGGGVRSFRPPIWSQQTRITAIGDSMMEGKWVEGAVASLGLALNNVAKYSSGAWQPYRLGTRPLYFTVTGNTIPASGAGVQVTAINGGAPSFDATDDPFSGRRFLNTTPGDVVATNCSVSGWYGGRHGVVSVPNGGTVSYTFTPDDGQPASAVTAQSIFVPDNLAKLATDELWIRQSQNYFYADYTPAFPNNVNERVFEDIQAMVDAARGQRIIILALTPPNGETAKYLAALAYFNNQLRVRWPQYAAYINGIGNNMDYIRANGSDGSANDAADIAAGGIPRSCIADGPHLNAKGQALERAFLLLYRAAQKAPPLLEEGTLLNLKALGINPRTGAATEAPASTTVVGGAETDLDEEVQALQADLAEVKSAQAAGAHLKDAPGDYRTELGVGGYFTSPLMGVLHLYKVVAAAPYYEDRGALYDKSALGLSLVENIAPDQMPYSVPQQAAVTAAISALVGGAPGALDTLKELADAIGDDANFAATVTNALAARPTAATLATSAGASSIGIDPSGLGELTRTIAAAIREQPATLEQYGGAGDDATLNDAALAKLIAAKRVLYLPEGKTYRLSVQTNLPNNFFLGLQGRGKLKWTGAAGGIMFSNGTKVIDEGTGATADAGATVVVKDGVQFEGDCTFFRLAINGSAVEAGLTMFAKDFNVLGSRSPGRCFLEARQIDFLHVENPRIVNIDTMFRVRSNFAIGERDNTQLHFKNVYAAQVNIGFHLRQCDKVTFIGGDVATCACAYFMENSNKRITWIGSHAEAYGKAGYAGTLANGYTASADGTGWFFVENGQADQMILIGCSGFSLDQAGSKTALNVGKGPNNFPNVTCIGCNFPATNSNNASYKALINNGHLTWKGKFRYLPTEVTLGLLANEWNDVSIEEGAGGDAAGGNLLRNNRANTLIEQSGTVAVSADTDAIVADGLLITMTGVTEKYVTRALGVGWHTFVFTGYAKTGSPRFYVQGHTSPFSVISNRLLTLPTTREAMARFVFYVSTAGRYRVGFQSPSDSTLVVGRISLSRGFAIQVASASAPEQSRVLPAPVQDDNGSIVFLKNSGADDDFYMGIQTAAGTFIYTPVPRKVSVPATATSPGRPGNFAVSSTFRYDYTGDGTTHTWVRNAVATW